MMAPARPQALARRRADLALVLAGLLAGTCLCSGAAAQGGDAPPTANPYANQPYAGCELGFCEPADASLEHQFWHAAKKGDRKVVAELLKNDALNITRNIVPDSEGFARVIDVAVWTASEHGHREVMKLLLGHPGVKKMFDYEDGHILTLAAAKGDAEMVKLLLAEGMAVSPGAMAHAAHFNHTHIMELLLAKPMDLKSAMQAISQGGNEAIARILLKAIKAAEAQGGGGSEPQAQRSHDWHGEYVSIAVRSSNLPVLKLLLAHDGGYEIKWQTAQDLVQLAAEAGDPAILELLLQQRVFTEDADELNDAVSNALKVAAEAGSLPIIELLLRTQPELAKAHCKAGQFRAIKYGQPQAAQRLDSVCSVDVGKSDKLKDAGWLGRVLAAARAGDAAAMAELVKDPKAEARLRKLQIVETDPKTGEKQAPKPPHPKQDPLVIAASGGHLEIVKLLDRFHVLCAPCAAGEAAKGNHSDIVQHLAEGSAKHMMTPNEDFINHALRVMAYSMEQGNWGLVAWMVERHASRELGPYFLNAIAQEGKLDDMRQMLRVLREGGLAEEQYFLEQAASAVVTAGMGGHVEIVLELQPYVAQLPARLKALEEEEQAAEAAGGAASDKTEL